MQKRKSEVLPAKWRASPHGRLTAVGADSLRRSFRKSELKPREPIMRDEIQQKIAGNHDLRNGLVAGAIGGLIASWTMNRFQTVLSRRSQRPSKPAKRQSDDSGTSQPVQAAADVDKPATLMLASAISEGVFHHHLTENEKRIAEPAVHYGFGTTMGGLYGALAEVKPRVTTGAGLVFGTALWLTADEAAVPVLGLAYGPTKYPLSAHINALLSHLVYGFSTELVRRTMRCVWKTWH